MRGFWLLLTVLAMVLIGGPSRADDFSLPGLDADSRAYQAQLSKPFPAGGTAARRNAAEQNAAAAGVRKEWPAMAAALEQRLGMGQPSYQLWLDLATAQIRRTPPEAQKALLAAWLGFSSADAGAQEVPPLLVMADALRLLHRDAQAVEVLEQVVQRAPDDAGFKRQLAEAQLAAGMLVRRLSIEGEADPPRACVSFSVAPARRDDFNAADWVSLTPAVPGAAVTREGDQICVSGLPSGATTTLILRAGLPGEQKLALAREARLAVAMPNRTPTLGFDTRLFVLPRGQAPSVTLSTVNLSSVKLTLMRLTERNVAVFLRNNKLGDPVEGYAASEIGDSMGRVVWEGHADIAHWQANRTARTALPLPEALTTAGPGLYALRATAGDGTSIDGSGAVQMILRTDMAPTVWRGSDGLTVQMRSYANADVLAGVKLQLLAVNNDILSETVTGDDGVARFAAPLLHGEGPLAPAVLHAFGSNDDFAALDLNAAAFDLSDRGVEGQPNPGSLDGFVWLDRGIYRPGEAVQIMALLRDNAGAPADIPVQVTVKRPNGEVFFQATPARLPGAALHVPMTLSRGAAVGTWTIELRADPKAAPIGRAEFRVDAFVPDRMAVEIGPLPTALIPGTPARIPVAARFLYGAPGAGLTGKGTLRLVVDPAPFPALAGFHIGLIDEAYAPDSTELALPDTDGQGQTVLTVALPRAPDTTQALRAAIDVEVNDPAGHASHASASVKLRPAGPLIGIRPAFADDAVDAGAEAAFDVAAVSPEGTKVAMTAKLRLVRERPDWRLVMKGSLARYETVWRDEPLETRDIAISPNTPFHLAKKLDFGRYRIEVSQAGGMAVTSYRFRAGWTASDSPDVPDRADVSVDRRAVPAGENARIHIASPFAGQATLLVLSDRVLSLRTLSVAEGGTDVEVPVDAGWGPGAYVAVHVFRPGGNAALNPRPARAIGLVWVGVDPAARTLPVAINAPARVTPRGRATVPIHTAPGAWVSLAAVDEGILRLTKFASPDPAPHFLGRRTLGLDIRDDWGRLILPAEGEATLLRQGGDDGAFAMPDVPQHTVTLFTPPVQADADGNLAIPLDLPDFNGQVRLMAVAWEGSRIGAANCDIIVRDPLVAEMLLPRFLAPDDEARFPVLLQNLDLPAGEAAVTITTEGPLALAGPSRLAATLAPGAQTVPTTILRGTGAGRGVIHLDVTGPGGFHIQREAAITVRPSRGAMTLVSGRELPAGAQATLAAPEDQFLPGTWHAVASFGAPVRYDAGAMVQALISYPLSCLEQTTSRGLPLVFLPDGPVAGADRAARLQAAVASVLDRQRYDGGFALWVANGEAEPWLSAYAVEFLLRAKAAGATVPDQALKEALSFLADAADGTPDTPAAQAAQAYRLYVLAYAGRGRPGAARVLAETIDSLPTPLAKAQLGAALALGHDAPRAEAAFRAALAAPARTWWHDDYGSSLRDQAAMVVLLKESGLLPQALARLEQSLPGADLTAASLSTQEQAWTAAAAGALGRDGRAADVELDGQKLTGTGVLSVPLTGRATVRNAGAASIWQSVSATGVPRTALPAARQGMRIVRNFFNLDGSTLDLAHLKQNTVFVLLLEGRADDGQDHQAMLLQGLPAGWEIASRIPAGPAAGMAWLGTLSDTQAQPAADDRFAAVMDFSGEKPDFRVAVRLRAVTPGTFELPGAELSDMYRPAIFARQGANRLTVQAAE